jgi:hypothetical protein
MIVPLLITGGVLALMYASREKSPSASPIVVHRDPIEGPPVPVPMGPLAPAAAVPTSVTLSGPERKVQFSFEVGGWTGQKWDYLGSYPNASQAMNAIAYFGKRYVYYWLRGGYLGNDPYTSTPPVGYGNYVLFERKNGQWSKPWTEDSNGNRVNDIGPTVDIINVILGDAALPVVFVVQPI